MGVNRSCVTEQEVEFSRLRKELVETKRERDLLKKTAAHFARKSLPGSRTVMP